MIKDLDNTIEELLISLAPVGSELSGAAVSFDIPDIEWRNSLGSLTVNCYLYDIHENLELRTYEPLVQRDPNGTHAAKRDTPRRINCAYCITAWSRAQTEAVLEEHRVLSQVLQVLLKNPVIPEGVLQGDLVNQHPPYPTVIASSDGMKNNPEFWGALDQRLKPSLNYIVTLAMQLDEAPAELTHIVENIDVGVDHKSTLN